MTALDEVEAFVAAHPDAPVYLVDVRAERPLSQSIAARSGIRHESPQVIIFRRGAAVWNISHHDITGDAIRRNLSTM